MGSARYSAKAPGRLTPTPLGIGAEMAAAGEAVTAMATDDVPFAADDLTGEKVFDVRAHLHDLADEFMAHHHRNGNSFSGPFVPFINVDIGPADAGAIDADEKRR